MYYVYILYSEKDGKLYIGSAPDLKKRKEKHDNGYVLATKFRRPLKLIYYEAYLTQQDAKRREIFLKGGKGHEEMKIQLKETYKKINYKCRYHNKEKTYPALPV
jgi:putative endonuclease